jgi:hypothetical protein
MNERERGRDISYSGDHKNNLGPKLTRSIQNYCNKSGIVAEDLINAERPLK